ncbi:hypothetical protein IJI17_00880 [Candidatus Saccharibacteria bacterium]|nr:hypothetical protein [Candidatus Saccharibacteria bacterium]
MNKETIYIESGDDITDILGKLKSSEKKVIALVPPKKPSVLLSAVNIKLIARTAKAEKKAVVLVTTDDSLTKLAMRANLPVAPSLKSRPVMPESAEASKLAEPAETPSEPAEVPSNSAEKPAESKEAEASESELEEPKSERSAEAEDSVVDEIESEESAESASSKPEKKKPKKSPKESGPPVVAWINHHKAWLIFGIVAVAVITVFFIWALKIAPFVEVAVSVRTTSGNFSENVNFTTEQDKEKSLDGVFYVHEEKLEKDQTVKFTATGQKDMGDPASGSLVLYYQGRDAFSFKFVEGDKFAYKGLTYVATSGATLGWDGADETVCGEGSSIVKGCLVSTTISIKADKPGENYNVDANQTGWASNEFPSVNVYNKDAISGGTSNIVTVVQKSDIDLALDKLASETKDTGKTELLSKLSDTVMSIDASFKTTATEPKSSPEVGEEVKEGVTPTVSSKTTYTILTLDKVRLEEFITSRANLEEGRKLYSIGSPFLEYFNESGDTTYTAKLKTTYKSGPEVSETEILEKIQGQKIGRVEPILKDGFSGISSVSIEKSYFWVNSIPKNPNQVKIKLEIEEK